MYCKSVSVTDYSTGTEYVYTSESGTSDSVSAVGGSIDGNIAATSSVATDATAPTITSTGSDAPLPWDGTHRETSSFVTPDIWPWVATATAGRTSTDPAEVENSGGKTVVTPFVVSIGESAKIFFFPCRCYCLVSIVTDIFFLWKDFPVYCISISLVLGFLFPLWR